MGSGGLYISNFNAVGPNWPGGPKGPDGFLGGGFAGYSFFTYASLALFVTNGVPDAVFCLTVIGLTNGGFCIGS